MRNHRGVDELLGLYLLCSTNGQMHVYLIASSVKIITKHIFAVYRFKSARMVSCWDLCVCSCAVICQYSCCQSRYQASIMIDGWIVLIMYWFTSWTMKYVTFYPWTNRLNMFSTCNLLIQMLLWLLLTNAWQKASLNIKYLDNK